MPTSHALADARYFQVQSITKDVVAAVQALWRDVTPDRIIAALRGETGRQLLNAVIAGQLSAAQGAQAFVTSAMLAQGAGASPLGTLVPGQLANIAADGRPLATLLMQPAFTTATALAGGMPAELAATRGLVQMAMIASTVIADTGRAANAIAMAAEPSVVSYVRVVKKPACARCLILAGRQYAYSEGFKRHPRCDCGMEPMSLADWRRTATPKDIFEEMTPEERVAAFGKAGTDAIEKGADINQVVNARRGMATATVKGQRVAITREGTTRRGIGGKALSASFEKQAGSKYARSTQARLMPEQILSSTGDRDKQVALLRRHGYIT